MSIWNWLDDRTGFRAIKRYVLDEPLPPGTGWWFTLGSVLLFGLAIQVVTGIAEQGTATAQGSTSPLLPFGGRRAGGAGATGARGAGAQR